MNHSSQPTLLITGCSSGIGHRCAEIMRQRQWRVFATARKEEDVAQLQQQGFESTPLDLDHSDSIERAVTWVLERTGGRLDALFNNGAYGQPGAVEDLSRDALRAQFETNLFGTVELTNRIIPVMRRQGHGRIVQNSSVLGLVAMPYRGAYNASKYALEGITDTLRLELRDSGIAVSLIEPGPILSRFRENAYRAFRREIDPAQSAHRLQYEAMERRLQQAGAVAPFTLPADAVADKLIHALESRTPRAHYAVTFPTHLFVGLRRLLPTRWLDRLLLKASGEGRR